jgi:hypothetical protein
MAGRWLVIIVANFSALLSELELRFRLIVSFRCVVGPQLYRTKLVVGMPLLSNSRVAADARFSSYCVKIFI